jgi:hypothetical protein
MALVTVLDIGQAAWARAMRDEIVVPLTATAGLPSDVAATPALRATAVSAWVPARSCVTGAAALWLWGYGGAECPVPFRVAVPRGRHPDPPPGHRATTWTWHTDSAAWSSALEVAGVPVARTASAIATALRMDDLAIGLPMAARALRARACDIWEVESAISATPRGAQGGDRQRSAWAALRRVTLELADERP